MLKTAMTAAFTSPHPTGLGPQSRPEDRPTGLGTQSHPQGGPQGLKTCAVLFILAALFVPRPLAAISLALDPATLQVSTQFSGGSVLLFGSATPPGDVVLVVRGAPHPVILREKVRRLGFWLNGPPLIFLKAPSFYWIASSAPLDRVTTPAQKTELELGLAQLSLVPDTAVLSKDEELKRWRQGLLNLMRARQLYHSDVAKITHGATGNAPRGATRDTTRNAPRDAFHGATRNADGLFSVRLNLPGNLRTGTYQVTAYHFRDGHLLSRAAADFYVVRAGVEAQLSILARQHSFSYAILSIVCAVGAGGLGYFYFRRR